MHYFAFAGDIVSYLEKQRSGEEEEGRRISRLKNNFIRCHLQGI